ncbi:hypothetical protein [Megalodesulfovibrio paquesii]
MSAPGFSRDAMWAVIKEWTRTSQSSVGRELHAMAERYERHRKMGLLPSIGEYIAAQSRQHTPGEHLSAPHTLESDSGGIVHDKA